MQTLEIVWQGETYEFKPSFELFMRIEEKVSFNRIVEAMRQNVQGYSADLPMSHVAWVIYCCLRHAGAQVRNALEVHQGLFDGSVENHGDVLGGLILAYYGTQPEKPLKKSQVSPRDSHSHSRKISKSATGSQ